MATATAQREDDLIIIADESDTQGSDDMVFSLDLGDVSSSEASTSYEDIPQRTDETLQTSDDPITNMLTQEAGSLEVGENEETHSTAAMSEVSGDMISVVEEKTLTDISDLSFDIGFNEVSENRVQSETSEAGSIMDHKEDLGEVSPTEDIIFNEISETSHNLHNHEETLDVSLNVILTQTIEKLQSRKKSITDETQKKSQKVQSLKDQIQALETEVATIEAEIANLGFESEKIDSYIVKLEEMMLDPVKEHNAKRSVKK